MSQLRICSSYPADLKIDNPALTSIRLIQEEVYVLPNITNLYQREDRNEGCMNRIAGNETDVSTSWESLTSASPHVKHFTVMSQTSPVILSAYDPVSKTLDTDVLSSSLMNSTLVNLIIVALIMLAFLFFRSHSWLYRRHKNHSKRVRYGRYASYFMRKRQSSSYLQHLICLILHQFSSCSSIAGSRMKSCSFKIMHISFVLFAFMLYFYYVSFIKTELVTVDQAVIIESYEQILETPGLKARWLAHDSDYQLFQNSDQDSVQYKLLQKSHPGAKISLTGNSLPNYISMINRSEIVLIGNWVAVKVIHQIMCPFARSLNCRPFITTSAHGQEVAKAMVFNDRLSERLANKLRQRVLRFRESGVAEFLHLVMDLSPKGGLLNPEDVRICRENHVQGQPFHHVPQKVMQNYASLFLMIGALQAAALLPLMMEVCLSFKKQRGVKGRRT